MTTFHDVPNDLNCNNLYRVTPNINYQVEREAKKNKINLYFCL